jgi:predicted ATP-dependent protease
VCKARGLSGEQGVLIPKSNVQHLMLREDIVEAVRQGMFAIHAVAHVDQGIEILTGVAAGQRGADGQFPAGTVNALVEDKLRDFAERARAFGARNAAQGNNGDRTS